MLRLERNIVIDAPVEDIFTYVVDPAHAPEFWVGVDAVKDIQRLPDGRYTFTVVAKRLGLVDEEKFEYTEIVPNERIVAKGHSPFVDIEISLRFERLGSRQTLASSLIAYAFTGGPLAKFGEVFLGKYLDHATMMTADALKARIEAGILATPAR